MNLYKIELNNMELLQNKCQKLVLRTPSDPSENIGLLHKHGYGAIVLNTYQHTEKRKFEGSEVRRASKLRYFLPCLSLPKHQNAPNSPNTTTKCHKNGVWAFSALLPQSCKPLTEKPSASNVIGSLRANRNMDIYMTRSARDCWTE